MAKGWRKDDYNRQLFGQRIREYRLTLQWSLGHLAQLSGMNKGTLQHVEKGEAHLPGAKRQRVIDVLTESLQQIGQSANRREFLKLAGLTTASTVLSAASSITQLHLSEIPVVSSQEKLVQDRPHEEYAEMLNQQQAWQQAATFWLLAAQEAKHRGDWAKWSRCQLSAGLMALNCSQFEIAERRFKEVIDNSQDEVSSLAVAEAHIRLGWLYYEQDKFSQARQTLLKSRTLLQNPGSKHPQSLHLPQHGCTLVCEGNEVIMALESTRLHWLGRTNVDWGIEQDNQALVKEGLAQLQQAGNYDSTLGLFTNVGFALLRQIPALLYEGASGISENYLARSKELLGARGTVTGHIALHKGLLMLEEQPGRAIDFLGSARAGFVEPTFYSRGLSEVLKELSGASLMSNKKTEDQMAFQYAMAATVLHPYSRNLEILQLSAHKMYWRLGENLTAFNTFWQTLEEKLWSMDTEPFSDLRYLMRSSQEQGIHVIDTGIEVAKKAIWDELFRK